MFGLSAELITYGKLATVKRDSSADVFSISPLSEQIDSLMLKTSELKFLYGGQFTQLVIDSVDKPNICC